MQAPAPSSAIDGDGDGSTPYASAVSTASTAAAAAANGPTTSHGHHQPPRSRHASVASLTSVASSYQGDGTRLRARTGSSLGGSTAGSALALALEIQASSSIAAGRRKRRLSSGGVVSPLPSIVPIPSPPSPTVVPAAPATTPTLTPVTDPPVLATALAYVTFFELGALVGLTGPAVPALAAQLGNRRETQFGAAFTCRGSGYLVGSVLASMLGSSNAELEAGAAAGKEGGGPRWRMGARPSLLMGLALLLAGAATAGVVGMRAWAGFLTLMVTQGIGLGMVDVWGNALLLETWAGHRWADPLMQGLHALFGAGAVLSPAVLGAVGYQPAFLLFAAGAAVPLLCWSAAQCLQGRWWWCWRRPQPASPLTVAAAVAAQAEREEELSLSRHVEPGRGGQEEGKADGDGEGGEQAEAEVEEEEEEQQLPPIPRTARLLICGFFFLYVGLEVGYGGWIASVLLLEHLTDSPAQASYAVACFWFTITAGRVAAIGLSALLPPRRLLLGQMALLTVGAVLLAITLPLHTLPGTTTAGAVFGLGMSSVFPTMLSLPREMGYSLDVHSTGRVLVAACLGEGLLPVAMGEVMRAVGTGAFPYCVLVGVAGMWLLAMALLLPRWLPSCCRPRGGGGAGLSSQQQQLQQKGFEMMRREEEEKEGGVGRGLSVGIAG